MRRLFGVTITLKKGKFISKYMRMNKILGFEQLIYLIQFFSRIKGSFITEIS